MPRVGLTRSEPEPLWPPLSPRTAAPGAPRTYLLVRNGARNGMAGVSGYLAGRKRNADQVPSIDTWRTGCTPWPASAATSRSRLRSVPSWPPFG